MSHGSETRVRTTHLTIRLSTDERATIDHAADRSGLTPGSYARQVMLGAPVPRQVRRPPVERRELARLLGELGHVGSNLNQIARNLNCGGTVALPALQRIPRWFRRSTRRDIDSARPEHMIIKGKSRSEPQQLATHLGNAKNERVTLIETRGTIAQDLRGALLEIDAYGIGTNCEKPLYHAAISPEPPHVLTPEQRAEAIDALEEKLGFVGHARVVVMHEKLGRQHIHVVWSRIDLQKMRSVSDSHNYRKHEEVARALERRFGHDRVQGAHHEREGIQRPDRTPSHAELQQQERTGIIAKKVKEEVTVAFRTSDGPQALTVQLHERGYILARGDRRDYVIIDRKGGVHSLARRIDGIKAAELKKFMAPLDRESVPTVEHARKILAMLDLRSAEPVPSPNETRVNSACLNGDEAVNQTPVASLQAAPERAAEPVNEPIPSSGEAQHSDEHEMADSRPRHLDRLPGVRSAADQSRDHTEDHSSRQQKALGGGRTRSR